jgi:ABC-type glycerol-3-phosphate transport system substrate-binding protein
MHRRLALALLSATLLIGACGGGDDDAADDAAGDETTVPAADDGGGGSDLGDGGDVDCAAVTAALEGFGLDLQLMAQLRTPAQYALIKDGTLSLDPDKTLAHIEALRALEGFEIQGTTTSVEEALDVYEEAAQLTKENLAAADPFADAKGDELAALTEDVGAFLGGQLPIGMALDAAGCS